MTKEQDFFARVMASGITAVLLAGVIGLSVFLASCAADMRTRECPKAAPPQDDASYPRALPPPPDASEEAHAEYLKNQE